MALALEIAGAILVAYLLALAALFSVRPDDVTVRAVLKVIPDAGRLIARLARSPEVPRTVRLRLLALLAYLASPIDLVPDFVPVLGYADDAILIALVLRSVVRSAGPNVVRRAWPGEPDGLDLLLRALRVATS